MKISCASINLAVLCSVWAVTAQVLPDPSQSSDVGQPTDIEQPTEPTVIVEPTPSDDAQPTPTDIQDSTDTIVVDPTDTIVVNPTDTIVVDPTITSTETSSRITTEISSSASETTATSTDDGEMDIIPVASTYGGEAQGPVPTVDVTDAAAHQAEYKINMPRSNPSEAEAKELAANEAFIFKYFVENDPAPGDAGNYTIPDSVSTCSVNLGKRSLSGANSLDDRSLTCTWITKIEFDVYFNYILPNSSAKYPPGLPSRILESVRYMNEIYEPSGLKFNFKGYQQWRPPASGKNKDWSKVVWDEKRMIRWQELSHKGNMMALNIWLLNDVSTDDGVELNGYATFPWYKSGKEDGIVLRQDKAIGTASLSLVHEVGHWLGLKHTFGEWVEKEADDCIANDGLVDTSATRGLSAQIFDCEQVPCFSDQPEYVYNFMSYSVCRGRWPAQGISTDQKTAAFARTIKWRRSFKETECWVSDPDLFGGRQKAKRSTMQDLLDGKCPDVNAGAAAIANAKTAGAARFRIGSGAAVTLACLIAGGLWAL